MAGPLERYKALVADGVLTDDPAQEEAAKALQALHRKVARYEPGRKGLFGKRKPAPEGLYLWGGVGRGKSLLMDLFFNNSPVRQKRRLHFHEFMVSVHEAMADWRSLDDAARKEKPYRVKQAKLNDPVPHIARWVFQSGWLICFDEFQVTDIADAMLLGRLFGALFEDGAVIIATSNRHPDDLYKDGINRDLFVPFIGLLKDNVEVHELAASRDYRLEQLAGSPVYHCPLGPETDADMDKAWTRLIAGGKEHPATHMVRGRELALARTARGAARMTFESTCARPLGAEDYLCIARNYHTVFMDGIPKMTPEKRNEAKRFVTFIDALYEHRTKFVCSADAEPNNLYPDGDGSFEFSRTVSRLMEMQSERYLSLEHAREQD